MAGPLNERAARLLRDPLRLHQCRREQRFGLWRPHRRTRPIITARWRVAMWIGRFFIIVPMPGDGREHWPRRSRSRQAGSLPTTGGLLVGLVIVVMLIMGGLTFLPALALGPIADHLAMTASTLF